MPNEKEKICHRTARMVTRAAGSLVVSSALKGLPRSSPGRRRLRDHVTQAQWTRSRYHVKVKILTVCRLGSGLLKFGALYRSGTVDQPS